MTACDAYFSKSGTSRGGWTLVLSNYNCTVHPFIRFVTNGGTIGSICENTVSSVNFNTTSDYRLKENVKDLTGTTEILRALPVREYTFIAEPGLVHQGFIAHELEEFVPLAVSGKKDEVDEDGKPVYQAVDYSKVVPLLASALKETIARVDAQAIALEEATQRISSLEEKVKLMEQAE
jgi:hypothetical protein